MTPFHSLENNEDYEVEEWESKKIIIPKERLFH